MALEKIKAAPPIKEPEKLETKTQSQLEKIKPLEKTALDLEDSTILDLCVQKDFPSSTSLPIVVVYIRPSKEELGDLLTRGESRISYIFKGFTVEDLKKEFIKVLEERKIKAVKKLAEKLTYKRPYHNFAHELDVYKTVSLLTKLDNIDRKDKFLLQTAALLHDNFYKSNNLLNEEKSVERAKKYLLKIGYSIEQVRKIEALILSTKLPQNPSNFLEKIFCDADLDHLGREDCFEKGEKYRQELEIPKEKWVKIQLRFLQNHKYYTESAKKLRDKRKQENIQKLKKILEAK